MNKTRQSKAAAEAEKENLYENPLVPDKEWERVEAALSYMKGRKWSVWKASQKAEIHHGKLERYE